MLALLLWLGGICISAATEVARVDAGEDATKGLSVSSVAHEQWKEIASPALSADGRWAVYKLTAPNGRTEVVLRDISNKTERRILSRSATGSTQAAGVLRQSDPITITADSAFVLFTGEMVSGKREGAEETSYAGSNNSPLVIVRLNDQKITMIDDVLGYALPSQSGRYVAYIRGRSEVGNGAIPLPGEKLTRRTSVDSSRGQSGGASSSKMFQRTLTVRELETGNEVHVGAVSEFVFDKEGRYLAYTTVAGGRIRGGAYVRNLETNRVVALVDRPGNCRGITFDAAGAQLAFFCKHATKEARPHQSSETLYYSSSPESAASPIPFPGAVAEERVLDPEAGVRFTRDGNALILAVKAAAPWPTDNELSPNVEPGIEVWHWQDPHLQSQLAANAELGRRSYLAVYHIAEQNLVVLASDRVPHVLLSGNGKSAIGIDPGPYLVEATWGDFGADLYVIDVFTGEPRLIRREFRTGDRLPLTPFAISPGGRYLLYFENRHWFSYDTIQNRVVDLTGAVSKDAEFHVAYSIVAVQPEIPIGVAGWDAGDERRVFVYDQYDIWELDLSGTRSPRNVTAAVGRSENIVFRLWPHERAVYYRGNVGGEARGIDVSEPLLLTAYDEDTGATGIWQVSANGSHPPERLLMLNKRVSLIDRAGQPEQLLLTVETFREFPDLWAGVQWDRLTKISNANPQQSDYEWGSAELVEWKSDYGVKLKGVLYTPAGFSEEQRYPLIVSLDFGSTALHTYFPPSPSRGASMWSPASYLANGYLVFRPDMHFVPRRWGESALAAVIPGVKSLIERGLVDGSRVGLLGHSAGGYLTTYIITQTGLFRCAVEGAGVSNLTSDYGSVMGHGMAKSYMYERTFAFPHGSRLSGSSMWQIPRVYIENSPVFYADRVRTPLLMLHNENDGAVSFTQAIELYLALRRQRKEVYLINYPDEGHSLKQYANQVDWDRRMRQFFDHFLLGSPQPSWMRTPDPRLGLNRYSSTPAGTIRSKPRERP